MKSFAVRTLQSMQSEKSATKSPFALERDFGFVVAEVFLGSTLLVEDDIFAGELALFVSEGSELATTVLSSRGSGFTVICFFFDAGSTRPKPTKCSFQ